MALTLRQLVADPALGLRQHAGGPALDTSITWVHVSELADPTPYLEGGELLLTTGLMARDRGDWAGFVARLAGIGVAGLGFGTGLSHPRVPAELVAAATDTGLPLVEVPYRTPFIALSKAVSSALAADAYAEVTRTDAAARELTRAAVSAAGTAGVVRRLARLVGGWAMLLGAGGRPIHVAPQAARDARSGAALAAALERLSGRGPASTSFPLDGEPAGERVTVLSLGAGAGYLAVGTPGSVDPAGQRIVATAAALLTLALAHADGYDAAERALRTGLWRLLLAGERALVAEVAGPLWGPLPDPPVRVALVHGPTGMPPLAMERWPGPVFHAGTDADLHLLLPADDAMVAALVAACAGRPGVVVGLSEPTAADLAVAARQARTAADAARRTGRPFGSFAEIAGLGWASLLPAEDARAYAAALLAPLLRHDEANRGELVASLTEWLAHHGQWDPAAARLGVHRHTLRNRIRRAGELLGRDLDAAGVRAELWLALAVR